MATAVSPCSTRVDGGVDVGERGAAGRDTGRDVPGADRVGSQPGRVIRIRQPRRPGRGRGPFEQTVGQDLARAHHGAEDDATTTTDVAI